MALKVENLECNLKCNQKYKYIIGDCLFDSIAYLLFYEIFDRKVIFFNHYTNNDI